jgi:hypothetical protein
MDKYGLFYSLGLLLNQGNAISGQDKLKKVNPHITARVY